MRLAGRESLDMLSLSSPNRVGKLVAFKGRLPASPIQVLANPAAWITSGERAITSMWRMSPYLSVNYQRLAEKIGYKNILSNLRGALLETPYGTELEVPLLVPTVFLEKGSETTEKLLALLAASSGSPFTPSLEGDAIFIAREMLESAKMHSYIGVGIKEENLPDILKLSGIAREKGVVPFTFNWNK